MGPRLGAHGFGSFCRNKRISQCGGETPQNLPRVVRGRNPASFTFPFCHPCEREDPETFLLANKEKTKTLDPRSGSGMTDKDDI